MSRPGHTSHVPPAQRRSPLRVTHSWRGLSESSTVAWGSSCLFSVSLSPSQMSDPGHLLPSRSVYSRVFSVLPFRSVPQESHALVIPLHICFPEDPNIGSPQIFLLMQHLVCGEALCVESGEWNCWVAEFNFSICIHASKRHIRDSYRIWEHLVSSDLTFAK